MYNLYNFVRNQLGHVLLIFMLTSGNFMFAQNNVQDSLKIRNSAYLELGGNGFWYSLNYDRVLFDRQSVALTGRLGLSYIRNSDTNTFIVPLAFNFLIGESKNFLEIGTGSTLLLALTEDITGLGVFGIVGYRYQPMLKKGLVFRLSFTPFIGEITSGQEGWDWLISPWGGVSVGYAF